MARTADKDKPYVDNYPPLKAWLDRHEARCNWQLPLGGTKDNPTGFVESFMVKDGGEVIVVIHARQLGWNLYTPCHSNGIAATLADADARLRLEPKAKTEAEMEWEDVCHWIAQGAVNIAEGENTIEANSKIHRAMAAFCTYVAEGLKPRLTAELACDKVGGK